MNHQIHDIALISLPSPKNTDGKMKILSYVVLLVLRFEPSRSFALHLTTKHRPETQRSPKRRITERICALSSSVVEGLLEDFDCKQRAHETIQNLRKEVPLLLYQPYTEETAGRSYTVETKISVGKEDYVVASSREEVVSLQNALLIAVQGPLRATNILSRQNLTAPIINCCFLVQNEDASEILVDWDLKAAGTNFSGLSEILLEDGKVCLHRLQKVKWNGQNQDAEAVGNALSRIRQTVRSFRQAENLQSTIAPLGTILSQYRDDIFRSLDIAIPSQEMTAPITFGTRASDGEILAMETKAPIPGSHQWESYARAHCAIGQFIEEIIPKLAFAPSDAAFDLEEVFLPDARMFGLDGTVILPNGRRLAKFYQSLALWRRRSLTKWTLVKTKALQWEGNPQVQVSFTIDLPGSEASLCGSDIYTLDVDADTGATRIQDVEQESMSIGNNSKQQDLVLFMKGLVAAVENDRFVNADEQWLVDMWNRLRATDSQDALDKKIRGSLSKSVKTPVRGDLAAATVYRIMATLHNDGKNLIDTSFVRHLPPALDFMIENVQFRGLLNEILSRGKTAYQRNLSFSIDSLRASLRSKRVSCDKEPATRVELTPEGNIRYALTLFLKIKTLAGLVNLLNVSSAGLPLKILLVSEYVLDPDSGRIVQHRLIESRINDQLTPGDILSRFLSRTQDNETVDDSVWARPLADFLGRLTSNRSST